MTLFSVLYMRKKQYSKGGEHNAHDQFGKQGASLCELGAVYKADNYLSHYSDMRNDSCASR